MMMTGLKNAPDSLIIILVHWQEQNGNITVPQRCPRDGRKEKRKDCANSPIIKKALISQGVNGGEGGIRTPGPDKPVNRFRVKALNFSPLFTDILCNSYSIMKSNTYLIASVFRN